MAKPVDIRNFKTPDEFINHAKKLEKQGVCRCKEGGNHFRVEVPGKGTTVVKRSGRNRQLGKGLLSAMIRQWRMLGLAIIAVMVLVITQ